MISSLISDPRLSPLRLLTFSQQLWSTCRPESQHFGVLNHRDMSVASPFISLLLFLNISLLSGLEIYHSPISIKRCNTSIELLICEKSLKSNLTSHLSFTCMFVKYPRQQSYLASFSMESMKARMQSVHVLTSSS